MDLETPRSADNGVSRRASVESLVGNVLALFWHDYRPKNVLTLGMPAISLFAICEVCFSPGSAPIPVPPLVMRIMYIGSAIGSTCLTGTIALVFRAGIERAEIELTRSNRELEKLSTTDSLTGLINRRGMDSFLGREWARMHRERESLAVLICDVDYFKAYNDHYGHPAGDDALQHIAATLRATVRRPADLVARYGGEEFVLILPQTETDDARRMSEQVRTAVADLAIAHARSPASSIITVSVGFSATIPDTNLSSAQLFQAADRALYTAKQNGRNQIAAEPVEASRTAGDSQNAHNCAYV